MLAVLIVLTCFQHSNSMQFDSSLFRENFDRRIQWNRDNYSVFNFQETMISGIDDDNIVSILNFETRCSISAASLV